MRRNKTRKRKGFTLVELLVVIVLISLLAGTVGPKLLKQIGKAKKDLARPKMTAIESAIDTFYLNCGVFPSNLEELLYCPNGYGKTKLNNNYLESRLNVIATTRNWKTTNELFKIARHVNKM